MAALDKCLICTNVAKYKVTPYTGTTPGTAVYYCEEHALDEPVKDTGKTYKIEVLGHTYSRSVSTKVHVGRYSR